MHATFSIICDKIRTTRRLCLPPVIDKRARKQTEEWKNSAALSTSSSPVPSVATAAAAAAAAARKRGLWTWVKYYSDRPMKTRTHNQVSDAVRICTGVSEQSTVTNRYCRHTLTAATKPITLQRAGALKTEKRRRRWAIRASCVTCIQVYPLQGAANNG